MPESLHAGDLLARRYRLDELLTESAGGRFWRAHDQVLDRDVAVHVIASSDPRADGLLEAARRTAPHHDRRLLRVLDADRTDDICYVVNEWGSGTSLDIMVANGGPLPPRRAAWIVSEVAASLTRAHEAGLDHGRMVPENVLVDHQGQVRVIGFCVDAALHGLPAGRQSADLVDTVAVLYAALTGKWAGVSDSLLPPAPMVHGAVLRPRRVRAGIPRTLDALCDQVINRATSHAQRSEHDLSTMGGVAEALTEFVGDPTGLAEGGGAWTGPALTQPLRRIAPLPTVPGPPTPVQPTPVQTTPVEPEPEATHVAPVPPLPAPGPTATQVVPLLPDPEPVAEPEPALDPQPAPTTQVPPVPPVPAAEPTAPVELPTQAGIPVFAEDDEVGWIPTRSESPAPPPPFEDKPVKPLFAPEPEDGGPVRRPRPGSAAAAKPDYWPWESTGPGSTTGPQTGAGTGPVEWGTHDPADTGAGTDVVPGRSWIRLAMGIALALILLVGAVAIYHAVSDTPDDDTASAPSTPPSPSAAPTALTGITASDFDPQGDPAEEYPELVPLALDGDPATAWRTSTYNDNFGLPTSLKSGVGLVLDLGASQAVREIDVATAGGATSLAVYVGDTAPTGIADLTPAGEASGEGTLTVTLDPAVTGQFVTVWLTSLPAVEDGFRGTITDVVVKG